MCFAEEGQMDRGEEFLRGLNAMGGVREWNARVPEGTRVRATDEMGVEIVSKTRGEAFVYAGEAVVRVSGRLGVFSLRKVRVISREARVVREEVFRSSGRVNETDDMVRVTVDLPREMWREIRKVLGERGIEVERKGG